MNIDASPTPIENLVLLWFPDWWVGADFNNVGAIEATVALSANTDVVVSIVESRVLSLLLSILQIRKSSTFRSKNCGGNGRGR